MFLSPSVTLLCYLQLLPCHVICIVLLIFVEGFVIINKFIVKCTFFFLVLLKLTIIVYKAFQNIFLN